MILFLVLTQQAKQDFSYKVFFKGLDFVKTHAHTFLKIVRHVLEYLAKYLKIN